jgi:hypothetical protein
MKKVILIFSLIMSSTCAISQDKTNQTNDFYDNEETFHLPLGELEIAGEIENPGKVDFSRLNKRSVIVKETRLNINGSNDFTGAFRYDGYSLFDILNDRILKKQNKDEFPPIIDMYIIIENVQGERVILSWGEIYYPNYLHQCIIASDVMRIVPSKTKELWALPMEYKLVIAPDLIAERNISRPIRITVKSWSRSYEIHRELKPLFSPMVTIFDGDKEILSFSELPGGYPVETLHSVFYGKGRGIHSTEPFTGIYLKDLLKRIIPVYKDHLMDGLIVLAGVDGYRAVYTYSEIMNRNDQAEVLLVPCADGAEGGIFRIFPSCDFFSDRAVKALSEIRIDTSN